MSSSFDESIQPNVTKRPSDLLVDTRSPGGLMDSPRLVKELSKRPTEGECQLTRFLANRLLLFAREFIEIV